MRFGLIILALSLITMMPASARSLDANFLIKRQGKVIGYHQVDVTDTGTGKVVETNIEMKVKFGPIPVFRYQHRATENWRDGALESLTAITNDNGDKMNLNIVRNEEGLMIDGEDYKGPAPADAAPSSYWNKALVEAGALINTQTGEIIDVAVTPLGKTATADNRMAEHFRIVGTLALNLWYDGARWVGCNFIIDGEELTYELVETERDYAQLEDFMN